MIHRVEAEIAVIGSGAGGSVVAYHLARHGATTVVVERGPNVRHRELDHDEAAMIARLYKDGGAQTNSDGDMFVLQGSCVGGSTVLTNGVCFRMAAETRRALVDRGFPAGEGLDDAYARVESVLGVAPMDPAQRNPATDRLDDGFRRLGRATGSFDKCMLDCIGCGHCNIGCRYGRKLDAARTWIPMAREHDARIVSGLEATEIVVHRRRVAAIRCRTVEDNRPVEVIAQRYVLAGGAINTPELLLRSKILPDRAGRRTSFNAGAIVFAEYPDAVDAFAGDQMGTYHRGDGFLIEQIHNPPVATALTLGASPARHATIMQRYRHLAGAGVLVPTQPVGRVFLGLGHRIARRWFDHADIRFRMPEADVDAFRRGVRTLTEAFLESGATRVLPPASRPIEIRHASQLDLLDDAFRDQRDIVGFGSSHPLGGAPLGDDARRDVVAPDFRVHGVDNLFVADASVFPTGIGVNPMLSVMAIADRAVESIGGFRPTAIDEGPAWEARRRTVAADA